MILVADSGPLRYLILEQTELLPRFYSQVFVPEAVLRELTASKAPQRKATVGVPPHPLVWPTHLFGFGLADESHSLGSLNSLRTFPGSLFA